MTLKLKIIYHWLKLVFRRQPKSKVDIAHFQEQKMSTFANAILSKSIFYKKYFVGQSYDWSSVPLISKTEFMAHFDDINTVNIKKEDALKIALDAENSRNFKSELAGITVGLSTGTSGKRGIFLVSKNERAMWVALVMHRVIKPRLLKKQKVAFFLRANSNLYASVQSRLFDFQYFDIFTPLSILLKKLTTDQPDIVAAQPSVLIDICLAQQTQEIDIKPTQIISFAEVLHDHDRALIEDTFKLKITEIYQCTEGFLGVSCAHGTMHLNEDFIQFEKEWLDEDKFYPIITDFSRQSQPVVKYKMNDILQIRTTPCPCGSAHLAIAHIIGRDDDVLIFDDKKVYPDLIARKIALETDAFQKYTIVQTAEKRLDIGIACETNDFEALKKAFTAVLNTLLAKHQIQNVIYVFDNKITHITGNKTRKIRRLIHEN